MKIRALFSLILAGGLVAAVPAFASTIPNGTYTAPAGDLTLSNSADTLTGSVTFTGGTMTGNLIFTAGGKSFTFTSFSAGTCCNPVETTEYSSTSSNGGAQLQLDLGSVLSGGNIVVCGTVAGECGSGGQSYAHAYSPDSGMVYVTSGVLQGAAATPEPSSFVLMGSGLLGFVGMTRRRFLRA